MIVGVCFSKLASSIPTTNEVFFFLAPLNFVSSLTSSPEINRVVCNQKQKTNGFKFLAVLIKKTLWDPLILSR